jgi:hypothetical protein
MRNKSIYYNYSNFILAGSPEITDDEDEPKTSREVVDVSERKKQNQESKHNLESRRQPPKSSESKESNANVAGPKYENKQEGRAPFVQENLNI